MSQIIDLSIVTAEPLVLKFSEDDTFTIPPEPKVGLVHKLLDFQDKVSKSKSNKEQFDLLVQMVVLILSEDTTKQVNTQFIADNMRLHQLNRIVELYQGVIFQNAQNPN